LAKWNPQSPQTLFRTYLYNTVAPEQTPFYGPGPDDREAEYDEALAKKPNPGAVPFLVKGFWEIGKRMETQIIALNTLRGRLHEIDDGLNNLLQKHDLQISIRAAECRRKHLRLSHQCLGLAAKTQVLRNRGYAMDSAEEELRKKLLLLERSVFDPALNGRGEEIWARMVSVRERGRLLQREFEKAGRGVRQDNGVVVDEEVMKRVKKVCCHNMSIANASCKSLIVRRSWKTTAPNSHS
jgi:nuclear pore complex protein Nup54